MPININKLTQSFDLYPILFSRLPSLYRKQDAVLHCLVAVLLLWGVGVRIFNGLTHQFTPLSFANQYATAIPGLIIVWIMGVLLRERRPRLGLFLSSFSQSFLFILVVAYALSATITTPFPMIDHQLLAIDERLGFSSLGVLNWTYQFPWFVKLLQICYDTWFFQILLAPLILALLKDIKAIDRYLIATFLSLIIGAAIYYFWPTIAPAGILESPHFLQSQHELVMRFNQVHQSLPITAFGGGMIAFPSFHVVNCLLVTYAFRRYRYLLIPLLALNSFAIFSTMGLGYHYLVDVIGGFLLAYFSIKLADRLCNIFR